MVIAAQTTGRSRWRTTHGWRWRLSLLTLIAGIGVIAVGGLGGYSPYADVLAHGTGHAIGAVLGGFAALLLPRRSLMVLVTGAALTVLTHGLHARSATQPAATFAASARAAPGELRVISLNTHHRNGDLDRLERFIRAADADIVVLVEFGPPKWPLLRRLAALYPYGVDCARLWSCSIAILAKRAPSDSGTFSRHEYEGPPLAFVRFGAGAAALTVFGVHIMRPIDGARRYVQEIEAVGEAARAAPGAVLVAGDFNTTPWGQAFRRFQATSGLHHMGAYLPSWAPRSSALPQLAIDHMFASSGIRFDSVALGEDVGSDHRPLLARIVVGD